tara:strand:+ start:29 stop:685 length:657 start_codon:yes stop_codon:yes gene_type:complete
MPEVKDKATGKTIAKMDYDPAGKMAAEKMVAENPGYEINDGSMRSETMYAGGGKTGFNQIGNPMYGHGGMTPEMKKYEDGGKTDDEDKGIQKMSGDKKDGPSFFGGDFFQKSGKERRAKRRLKRARKRRARGAAVYSGKLSKKLDKEEAVAEKKVADKKAFDKKVANKSWSKAVKAKPKGGPTMTSLIKDRNKHKKGSPEYAKAQNEINKRYGVKKRH